MATIYGTNNDFQVPSLDLRFADRKNLVDTISGRNLITFSRNSIGTYVDENGVIQSATANEARFDHDPATGESLGLLVEESRTNELTYSDKLSQSPWVLYNSTGTLTPNSTIAPDDTNSAYLFTPDSTTGAYIIRYPFSFNTGITYTVSCFVKAAGRRYVHLAVGGLALGTPNYTYRRGVFDLVDGVVYDQPTSDISHPASADIQSYGNGWYRCSFTIRIELGGNANFDIYHADSLDPTTNSVSDGNSVDGIYVWGAQLEQGSFPTSYIPTPATFTSRASNATYYDASGVIQTAGIDVARDNAYFPDENGVMQPAGLLLEGSGTNLVTYSENFTTSGWWDTSQNNTVTPNATASPTGATDASLFTSSGGGTGSSFVRRTGYSLSGATYTLSVFAKAANSSIIWVSIYNDGFKYFDLSNGTKSGTGTEIQELVNGWYRCSVTATSGPSNIGMGLCDAFGSTNCTLDGSKSVYFWGAQIEESPYPTSYIPTAGSTVTRAADVSSSSTVTRAADVASITGTNFSSWYNQSEGTAFAEYDGLKDYARVLFLNTNKVFITSRSTINQAYDGVTDIASVIDPQITLGDTRKSVTAYSGTTVTLTVSGLIPNTGNLDFTSTTNTGAYLGGQGGSSNVLNGHISRLTYFPERLPDATLQAITS
jgi:hypothetical protein